MATVGIGYNAAGRFADMVAEDQHCAMCAADNPSMPTMVHGVPVRVCGIACRDSLISVWSMSYEGPKDFLSRTRDKIQTLRLWLLA